MMTAMSGKFLPSPNPAELAENGPNHYLNITDPSIRLYSNSEYRIVTKILTGQNTLHRMVSCMSCCCSSRLITCCTQVIIITNKTFITSTSEVPFHTMVTADTWKKIKFPYLRDVTNVLIQVRPLNNHLIYSPVTGAYFFKLKDLKEWDGILQVCSVMCAQTQDLLF